MWGRRTTGLRITYRRARRLALRRYRMAQMARDRASLWLGCLTRVRSSVVRTQSTREERANPTPPSERDDECDDEQGKRV